MTTISRNSMPSAEAFAPRRVAVAAKGENYLGQPRAMTAEEKADVARLNATQSSAGAEATSPGRVALAAQGENYLGKARAMTAEEKAELGRVNANAAAVTAASEKQLQEVKRSTSAEGMENHGINLPNISTLSLKDAKMALDVTQMMIDSDHYKGLNVNGHNGDQQISDLGTYKAVLTDYISKAAAPSQGSTAVASIYRQMQGMVGNDGGKV